MTPIQYLRAAQRHWLFVVVLMVLGGASAAVYAMTRTPTYSATVELFVSARSNEADLGQLSQGGTFAQQRVKSYADLVDSRRVTAAVIDKLDLPYSTAELRKRISTEVPAETVLLQVSVEDSSPTRSRDIANAIAAEFTTLVDQIETPNDQTVSPVKVSITDAAVTPGSPTSPRPVLDIALGIFAGIVLGAAAAVLRERLDRTIHSKEQVAEITGAPVLGIIGEDRELDRSTVISEESAARTEEFRQLRTNIRFISVNDLRSFVVTSSVPGEGKTTVAVNLAIALAIAGEQVVLIDADMRRPRIAEVLGLSAGVGLSNVLVGEVPVGSAVQRWREDLQLFVLPAGRLPPNPSELLGSSRLVELVESLVKSGTMVIFDSPPLLPVTDAALIARATGGAILVTRFESTRVDQLSTSTEALRSAGTHLLGAVLNRDTRHGKGKSYSTYYNVPTSDPARPPEDARQLPLTR